MNYPMPQTEDRSWWSRNWKWFLPVGCLGSTVLLGGALFGLIFTIFSLMRSSGAVQGALERAQGSPQAIDALGEPIKVGWWMTGNISVSGPSGEAELSIPLSGPRGSGTLYVIAQKQAGEWTFELLELALDNSDKRINLLSTGSVVLYWQLFETGDFTKSDSSDFEILSQLLHRGTAPSYIPSSTPNLATSGGGFQINLGRVASI